MLWADGSQSGAWSRSLGVGGKVEGSFIWRGMGVERLNR